MLRLFAFALFFFPVLLAAQSPWTRSKNGFYAQAAWHFIPGYDAIYPGDQTVTLDRRISENTFQLYGEYGLSRKTMIALTLPFRVVKAGEFLGHTAQPLTATGTLAGLGNVSLAVRHNFYSGKVLFTGQLRIEAPANRYDRATGLRIGYDALTLLPTISVGKGFGKAYGFAYAGYGARGAWENQFLDIGLEAGLRRGKFWLIGFSELVFPVGSSTYFIYPPNNYYTGLFLPDPGYWSVGVKSIYAFNKSWSVFVSAAGAGWGRLVPKRPGFGIGLSCQMD